MVKRPLRLGPGALLAVVAAVGLGMSMHPGLTGFDSGELVAGAFHLGNSHPPGQAPWSLLAQPFLLLPFGSVAFRVTLFSWFCAVFTVGLVYSVAVDTLSLNGRRTKNWERWALAALTLPLIGHECFVLQATRQEVYALNILLVVATAKLFLMTLKDQRAIIWMALVAGYETVLNPLLGVSLLPFVVVAMVRVGRTSGARSIVATAIAYLIPLLVLLYLPLRSSAGAIIDWGQPANWESFLNVVTASQYDSDLLSSGPAAVGAKIGWSLAVFFGAVGPVFIALVLFGLVLCPRQERGTPLVLVVAALLVPLAALLRPSSVSVFRNPDYQGYLAVGLVLFVSCGATGLVQLLRFLRARSVHRVTCGALAVALAASAAGAHLALPMNNLNSYRSERLALDILSLDTPARVAALLWTDNTSFPVLYAQQVGGLRPDSFLAIPPMFDVDHVRRQLVRDALLEDELGEEIPTVGDLGGLGFRIFTDNNSIPGSEHYALVPHGPIYRLELTNPATVECDFAALERLLEPEYGSSTYLQNYLIAGFLLMHSAQLLIDVDQPKCLPEILDLALAWDRGTSGTFDSVTYGARYTGVFRHEIPEISEFFAYDPSSLDGLVGDALLAADRVAEGFEYLNLGIERGSLRATFLGICWAARLGMETEADQRLAFALTQFPQFGGEFRVARESCH